MAKLLLSRSTAAVRTDKLRGSWFNRASYVAALSGGAGIEAGGNDPVSFFAALAAPRWWDAVSELQIGESIEQHSEATLLDGLVDAARRVAGRPLTVRGHSGAAVAPSALGRWLHETFGDTTLQSSRRSELEYFIASGGYRAHALVTMLRANYPGQRFPVICDLGAGMGFIAYMIAACEPLGVKRVRLIEPTDGYVALAKTFWDAVKPRPEIALRVRQTVTQEFGFRKRSDLVYVCQAFMHVPKDDRPAVLARVWESLRPGGLFVANEIMTDEEKDVLLGTVSRPLLRRDDLIALLSAFAPPKLFRCADGWAVAHDPSRFTAATCHSDSFMVIQKPF